MRINVCPFRAQAWKGDQQTLFLRDSASKQEGALRGLMFVGTVLIFSEPHSLYL